MMCTMGNSDKAMKRTQIHSIDMLNLRLFVTVFLSLTTVMPKNSWISGKWKVTSSRIDVAVKAAKDPKCKVIWRFDTASALVFSFLILRIATVRIVSEKMPGSTPPN